MAHIVLLGDSIFDNGRYVLGEPDVIAQVRKVMPAGGKALLLAVDGAMTDDVQGQVRRVPGEASHLVLSVGGNDALMSADICARRPARSPKRWERCTMSRRSLKRSIVVRWTPAGNCDCL